MDTLSGVKFDTDKPRYDLISPEFLDGIATVLASGAKKYGDRNWEGGFTWGRVFAALMRHSWAWWRGEEKDPESGQSHLLHAATNLMFLHTFVRRGLGKDDRVVVTNC